MHRKIVSIFLGLILILGISPLSFSQEENVIWQVKPKEGSYMKYFGKRVVDVNRAEADRLVPQEFGWQGNQLIFIFHLTSKQLQAPGYEFAFEIFSKDYAQEEPVELDIYAGTNINNLKTVAQGIKITKVGLYRIKIPSSNFYLGNQNFIKIFGRNVRPTGYGENPPNCRFSSFRLAIPGGESDLKETVSVEASSKQPPQAKAKSAEVVRISEQTATQSKPTRAS